MEANGSMTTPWRPCACPSFVCDYRSNLAVPEQAECARADDDPGRTPGRQ